MDFEEVLKYRQKYPIFSGDKDALYDAIMDGTYNYEYALLTQSIINKYAEKIFLNRYTDMIVQIPSPFAWAGVSFILLHFVEKKPEKLLTGIFKGKVNENPSKKMPSDGNWYVFEEKTEDFNNFIENINNYTNKSKVERIDLEVNEYDVFDIKNITPFYYTKQAIRIRNELKNSDYKILKDIAEIVRGDAKNIEGKFIDSKQFIYPLDYEKLPAAKITRAIKLVKGDIIGLLIGEQPKFYLYNEDFDDVYVKAGNYCVIRANNKEYTNYLFSYLNDEKARIYFTSTRKGICIPHFNMSDLKELKVIIPTEEMLKNANEFVEYTINSKKYTLAEINELIRSSQETKYKNESQKMINEDILKAISKMKNKEIRRIINDDLDEVGICFKNKAYKSAVILSGSILEAILLDWLSEYENTDKISETGLDNNGRDLGLAKIIVRLREIIKPEWYESKKAHEIREMRNIVHPKECIKNNTKVTVEECKRILNDLNDIIESKENRCE